MLKALVEKHEAKDSTVRKTAAAELEAMTIRTSQYNPVAEIPESNIFYRLAKRFWFYDFGAYKGVDHTKDSAPAMLAKQTANTLV